MQTRDRIYVAGHRGMVGSAIVRCLQQNGFTNLVTRSRSELDLTDRSAVERLFADSNIHYVFVAAAKVGGIVANDTQGGDFIRENLLIQTHLIDAAYRHGVKRLLFLGSSCIYPKQAPQPMPESCLLTGALEPTNAPYAMAKLAGLSMCAAYRKQYGFDAFTVMPCNVYGPGDNFNLETAHVAAALMRRMHEAKQADAPETIAWGSGTPKREFLFVDDLAKACLFLMQAYDSDESHINAGSGEDISIRALAELIADIVGYRGRICWDASRPDGTPRKLMDNRRITQLGWRAQTPLREGLSKTYQAFLQT